jgi:hypothetical protein
VDSDDVRLEESWSNVLEGDESHILQFAWSNLGSVYR